MLLNNIKTFSFPDLLIDTPIDKLDYVILNSKKELFSKNPLKQSILNLCVTHKKPEHLKKIIKYFSLEQMNEVIWGKNVLQQAISEKQLECAEILIQYGMDINYHQEAQESILNLALKHQDKTVLKFLFDNKLDLNIVLTGPSYRGLDLLLNTRFNYSNFKFLCEFLYENKEYLHNYNFEPTIEFLSKASTSFTGTMVNKEEEKLLIFLTQTFFEFNISKTNKNNKIKI